ncbi:Retrovirus-related Pol polyprotein from transposon gypsy [Dictyocoela muelleri]|nr:Retrovirus-related Pol polyprotein from transposon gypsy [Dictyocoela muelleri]
MELKRLKSEGIIEKSDGSISNPGFFIEKKNKYLRLVVDYRILNQNIIEEVCNIPNIFNEIQNMGKNSFFSKIDLKNGFNHIMLDKNSRKITGFNIMNNYWQYKRIQFGLKSGTKIFLKVINHILKDINNCFIYIYIDNIIIYSKSKSEHDDSLRRVLSRLYERNAQINSEKSIFYKKN